MFVGKQYGGMQSGRSPWGFPKNPEWGRWAETRLGFEKGRSRSRMKDNGAPPLGRNGDWLVE